MDFKCLIHVFLNWNWSRPVLWADRQNKQLTVMTDFPDNKAAIVFLPTLPILSPLRAGLVTAFLGLHQLVTSKRRKRRCDPSQWKHFLLSVCAGHSRNSKPGGLNFCLCFSVACMIPVTSSPFCGRWDLDLVRPHPFIWGSIINRWKLLKPPCCS